jgi:hypothetical protein
MGWIRQAIVHKPQDVLVTWCARQSLQEAQLALHLFTAAIRLFGGVAKTKDLERDIHQDVHVDGLPNFGCSPTSQTFRNAVLVVHYNSDIHV